MAKNYLTSLLDLGRRTLPDYVMPGSSLPFENYYPYRSLPPFQLSGLGMPSTLSAAPQPTFASYSQPPTTTQPTAGPTNWLALGDQSRTAAYDPVRDANDPRNVKAVDATGRANALASIDDLIKRLIAQGVISG